MPPVPVAVQCAPADAVQVHEAAVTTAGGESVTVAPATLLGPLLVTVGVGDGVGGLWRQVVRVGGAVVRRYRVGHGRRRVDGGGVGQGAGGGGGDGAGGGVGDRAAGEEVDRAVDVPRPRRAAGAAR